MTEAYSYIRFSSVQQAQGDSLRRQAQLAQDYCIQHNLTLSETNYQDLGVSAFHSANTHEDNGLGQFLAALEQRVIPEGSYLLVESLDRLSRANVQTALRQMLNIIEFGIKIVTLIDNKIYDSNSDTTDLIISLTIMERAHNESKTKSERIKAAWAHRRQNPYTTDHHSSVPFWLELNDDKRTYTVKKESADIVKKIYQLSIDGWGIIKIVRYLNAQGIPAPKGGSWATSTVNRTLNTKAVLGHYEPRTNRTSMRIFIENYYPAIIDEDTYYLSQMRKSERSNPESAGRKSHFPNPLNQIAKCKVCGSPMAYDNKSPTLRYLTCREYKKKNCKNTPIRMELIYRFILEVFNTPLYLKSHAELVTNSQKVSDSESKQIKLRHNLEDAQKALRDILTLSNDFSNSVIQDAIKTRSELIKSLENELESVKAEVALERKQTPHLNLQETIQLTVDAFQFPANNVQPNTLTPDELYSVRVKLNRVLKHAFDSINLLHNKETQEIEIETEKYKYKTNKKAIDIPIDNHIWIMS